MISDLFRLQEGEPAAVATLARLAARMPEDTRALWRERFFHVYGDLGGQRGVDPGALHASAGLGEGEASVHEVIFGVQTFFAWLAHTLAVCALEREPERRLRSWSGLRGGELRRVLQSLSSGAALEERGVYGGRDAFGFDWYLDVASDGDLRDFAETLGQLAARWDDVRAALARPDPLSALYSGLLARNLLHVLGEVHTPGWLAEMLLLDSGWSPESRLIDPFAGSGVFGLAALRIAVGRGVPARAMLPRLCLVDLNPVACAAARSNLVIALASQPSAELGRAPIVLPVLNADALAGAWIEAEGDGRSARGSRPAQIDDDGEPGPRPRCEDGSLDRGAIAAELGKYHLELGEWLQDGGAGLPPGDGARGACSTRDRLHWEQRAARCLSPADFVATNPPWVGWEYMARPYRDRLEPAWRAYGLFTARGRDASFLKEDLSTLALTVAWDRYLRAEGESVAVVRANTMTSTLAARGLRRMSLFPDREPMELLGFRVFDGVKVFPAARVQAASWRVRKGERTGLPVDGLQVGRRRAGWQPRADAWLDEVRPGLTEREVVAERVAGDDPGSRWVIGERSCVAGARAIAGTSAYVGRTGVFTGGANAVYYVSADDCVSVDDGEASTAEVGWFRNVTARAKRGAPPVRMRLERALVHEVIRGRDVQRWRCDGGAKLLCPHTRQTRMRAIAPEVLRSRFPHAWSYLSGMRAVLDARRGFTAWERSFRDEAFYAIQRIGDYTFSPYKVVWRYIASDFIVAVAGPGDDGKPLLPNDKVIFVGFDDPAEAHYLCGLLSSDPIRWKVIAFVSSTQISASAIASLRIPTFDGSDRRHLRIAEHSRAGHAAVAAGDFGSARRHLEAVNDCAGGVLGIDGAAMAAFRDELRRRFPRDWTVAAE
ncbi:MAG: hypothetical protein PVI30_22375 [Myxococcales bacterium]|jgi:hypothetical protein